MEALFLTIFVLEMFDSMIGPTTPMTHIVLGSLHILNLWLFRLTYTGFDESHPLNASLAGLQNITNLLPRTSQRGQVNGFVELAMLSKTLEAGDSRDKIFAFLGL